MAGLIEDLLAGLPQAYSTLEELLAQSKLGRQHYGPKDSMIASTVAHPVEGAQKAGQWLQDQIMTASQSPVQPMTDPRGAEAGSLAGMNLAGLMQAGGLPFGPTGPGVLGTIKKNKIPLKVVKLINESKNRINPEDWTRLTPKMDMAAEVAHSIRGKGIDAAESVWGHDDFFDSDMPIEELYKFVKSQDFRSGPFDDISMGIPTFNRMVKSSEVKLPKPMYVTREWEQELPMRMEALDDHVLSTRVVNPAKTDTYKEHYWGADVGNNPIERSFIYKLPAGSKVLHPGNLADKNEAVINGKTLREAKQMGIKDYIDYIAKHGSAPFALGALGIGLNKDKKK